MKKSIVNKYKKLILSIFLLMTLVLGFASTAFARSGNTGTLTLRCVGKTEDNKEILIINARFLLYAVAENTEGGWSLKDSFKGSGASLEDWSAAGQKKAAEDLYKYSRDNNIKSAASESSGLLNGIAVFKDIPGGLYLAAQEAPVGSDGVYYMSSPFLVKIPGDDGSYELTAEPKFEITEKDPDKDNKTTASTTPSSTTSAKQSDSPEGNGKDGKDNPIFTGDDVRVITYVSIIAAVSTAVMIALIIIKKERRYKDNGK